MYATGVLSLPSHY